MTKITSSSLWDRYFSTCGFSRRDERFPLSARDRRIWHAHYDRLLTRLPRDGRYLDVGCGRGQLVWWMRDQGFRNVRGVDISGEQTVRGWVSDLVCAEAEAYIRLEQQEDRHPFDGILTVNVLEHMPTVAMLDLLALFADAVGPNGWLCIEVPCMTALCHHRYADLTHYRSFTPESLRQALNLAGWHAIDLWEIGPFPVYPLGVLRWLIWQAFRAAYIVRDYAHAGTRAEVYSHAMQCVARRTEA